MSTNISTLASYDIDAITIETFRSLLIIGNSKHSIASWTGSWKCFHDPFSMNLINHNILHVVIMTKAAIAEKLFFLNLAYVTLECWFMNAFQDLEHLTLGVIWLGLLSNHMSK
jgi:hypothetical protein